MMLTWVVIIKVHYKSKLVALCICMCGYVWFLIFMILHLCGIWLGLFV